MKSAAILPFVGLTTAFVLPDPHVFRTVSFEHGQASKGAAVSSPVDDFDFLHSGIETALYEDYDNDIGAEGRPGHGHEHGPFNLTIYELISLSNHTKKFVELVNEHDSIVELLNSTEANYTLFVPTDEAFEHIPDGAKKPSKEFIEDLLKYHIGLGYYAGHKLRATHTIPTALNERFLGGEAQRLRPRSGLFGTNVNFYSRVVAGNVGTSNGVVHAVNRILAPPVMVGRELSLLPAQFSTLLLAYEKTHFVDFIHHVHMTGSTIFAPDNNAFARLGPRANAFLFNTEKGLRYLHALLKYQIVANATLYSDAYYHDDHRGEGLGTEDRDHLDLTTLLGDLPVSVDIVRFAGFTRMIVNGDAHVVVQDAIAKNGVIQVVNKVPIPPHKHHKPKEQEEGEIEVDELKERLEDYLEIDTPKSWSDDL